MLAAILISLSSLFFFCFSLYSLESNFDCPLKHLKLVHSENLSRLNSAPTQQILALSSDSDPSPTNSPIREDSVNHNGSAAQKKSKLSKKDENQDSILIDSEEEFLVSKTTKSKSPKGRAKVKTHIDGEENDSKGPVAKEEISEKHVEPRVSSSLPLVISEKVHRSKALVECEGDSIDMSGDVGAVGRIVISDAPSGNHEMLLDLKGTIYKTTILPSRTFCIVSFGQTEAKIEAIMNDFIQLTPQSNVYEAETMIEGTLDGFSFDSEEEADKNAKLDGNQNDQNNEADQSSEGKTKRKAEKALGVTRKKSKTAVKPPKKGKKKSQGPRKAKNSKK